MKIADRFNSEKYLLASDRINDMNFDDYEKEFIFADWSNWDEHLDWLLTANQTEIRDWIDAGRE